nr:MAG TPA: Protein of unknown function (DUF3143) [Caudoviricetes sp.]
MGDGKMKNSFTRAELESAVKSGALIISRA